MAKMRLRTIVLSLVLIGLQGIVQARTAEESGLLHKDYQLYQAWALSQDYHFGLTQPQNQTKAYAWLIVYLSVLPDTYPGKNDLKRTYQSILLASELEKAEQWARDLQKINHLEKPLSEEELHQIAVLKDQDEAMAHHPTGVIGRIQPWSGVQAGHIILKSKTAATFQEKDLASYPIIPITLTQGGSFYTTGLNPGTYQLYLGSGNLKTIKEFHVQKGEIRGLSLINLG